MFLTITSLLNPSVVSEMGARWQRDRATGHHVLRIAGVGEITRVSRSHDDSAWRWGEIPCGTYPTIKAAKEAAELAYVDEAIRSLDKLHQAMCDNDEERFELRLFGYRALCVLLKRVAAKAVWEKTKAYSGLTMRDHNQRFGNAYAAFDNGKLLASFLDIAPTHRTISTGLRSIDPQALQASVVYERKDANGYWESWSPAGRPRSTTVNIRSLAIAEIEAAVGDLVDDALERVLGRVAA